jgi:TolB-like protein
LRYIETVPKKGYRFIASVREVQCGPAVSPPQVLEFQSSLIGPAFTAVPPAVETGEQNRARDGPPFPSSTPARSESSRRRIAASGLLILVLLVAVAVYFVHRKQATPSLRLAPVQRSLAILPLRNLRQNPDDDFLGFSLADAVITKLGPVSSLTVRPSSAIEKYKGQTIDPRKVAADLNVDTLLTGTFIHEGDDLRITYQLIDGRTEKILGRDVINLKYEKLLAVQDDVTQQIIKGLALNLSPSEVARLKLEDPENPLAYEYYLRGVDLMGSHDFPLAIEMLEKSAKVNPNYALTWAYLGQSYNSTASFQFGGREQYRRAQAAFERALVLQPRQLEASIFLANLLIDTGEVEKAVPLLRDTQQANPSNAAVHWELGYAYRFAGMLKESVAECEQARQIDPSVKANGAVLNTYLYLGEYEKFLASLPDVDDSSFLVFYRGFGEFHQKNWIQAGKDFDRAYQLDHTLYAQIGRSLSDSIARRGSEGLELLHELESKIEQRGVGDPEGTYKIAEAYAVLGDKASALRMLRYSIEHGFFAWSYFITDPLLSSIRNEPQFADFMAVAHERHTAFQRRFF